MSYIRNKNNKIDTSVVSAINLYYNDNPDQVCPGCGTIGIEKSVTEDGNLFMKCKNDCGWSILIKKGNYVNIYDERLQNDINIQVLMYDILDLENFNVKKEGIVTSEETVNTIDTYLSEQKEELQILRDDEFKKMNDLVYLYYDRQNYFDKTSTISGKQKQQLVEIYKAEGDKTLTEPRTKQIAKQLGLEVPNTKAWLNWIDNSQKYVVIRTDVEENIRTLANKIKITRGTNLYYPLELPEVVETKSTKKKPDKTKKKIKIKKEEKKIGSKKKIKIKKGGSNDHIPHTNEENVTPIVTTSDTNDANNVMIDNTHDTVPDKPENVTDNIMKNVTNDVTDNPMKNVTNDVNTINIDTGNSKEYSLDNLHIEDIIKKINIKQNNHNPLGDSLEMRPSLSPISPISPVKTDDTMVIQIKKEYLLPDDSKPKKQVSRHHHPMDHGNSGMKRVRFKI